VRHGFWAVLLVVGGVLLAGRANAQCSKDTECKGERVCEQGQCVTPPKPAEPLPPPPPPPPASAAVPAPVVATAPAAAPAAAPRHEAGHLADAQDEPRSYRRRSPGLMTTGIVLTSSSLPFLLLTAVLSSNAYDDCVSDVYADRLVSSAGLDEIDDCQEARRTRSVAILLTTSAMLGVGIPLIVYGGKKVPAEQATITPWLSPTAAGATLRLSL
jgi:hypothetical protein